MPTNQSVSAKAERKALAEKSTRTLMPSSILSAKAEAVAPRGMSPIGYMPQPTSTPRKRRSAEASVPPHPAVQPRSVTQAAPDGGTLHDREGHVVDDTQQNIAPALTPAANGIDPACRDAQTSIVDSAPMQHGEGDQVIAVAHGAPVTLAPKHLATIDEIREQWRRRQSWHRAEKSLTLAAKAMCRRLVAKGEEQAELKAADALYSAAIGKGSHELADVAHGAIFPIIEARDSMQKHRAAVERRLAKIAATLPVAPFIASMRGVGIGSLAAIVGEAGDLGSYANPAKLWKRMGLAVMPDGRQRKVSGAAALLHGYSPQRRSVMWNIGDCIVKAGGPLRELYDARKITEHEKAKAEGLTVAPAAKIPKATADKYRSEGHIHNRSKRYIEKRVLLLLWRAWRQSAE